jgi:Lrp/AsnC family transcriptional regulator for asnA, asnC and gidA
MQKISSKYFLKGNNLLDKYLITYFNIIRISNKKLFEGYIVREFNLDELDNEIIGLLTEDGRMPIGELAKKLKVTAPTVRKRLKALEKNGIFKVSGLIDPSQNKQMITALVAMSVQSEGKLDQILGKIANLPNVAWAGVVTGRYDIMAEVVCLKGKDELYRFTTETILKLGNVVKSETFIIMRAKNNWLRRPKSVQDS